jgi:hypothetical protein
MSIDDARRDAARAMRARRLGIPEWQLEMAEGVGTDVIQDLVADSRRSGPCKQSPNLNLCAAQGGSIQHRSSRPTVSNYIDAMCEAQDRADRADRLREEMERRRALAALTPPELGRTEARPRAPAGTF